MPRRARLVLPDAPLHVTQRGVNRTSIFFDDQDRRFYLERLAAACDDEGVDVHAYVLMSNHVHLLVTPREPQALARALRNSGQVYAQRFNRRHGRTGALWQGRYGSSLVQSEDYLLEVMRYIELNPVRAGMVLRPQDHAWSSVHVHLGRHSAPMVRPHAQYLALGSNTAERVSAYGALLDAGLTFEQLREARRHLSRQLPYGDETFVRGLEATFCTPLGPRSPGRPKRSRNEPP